MVAFSSIAGSDTTLGAGASSFNGSFLADANSGIGNPAPIIVSFDILAENVSFWVADVDGQDVLTANALDAGGDLLETIIVNSGDTGTGDGDAFQVVFTSNIIKQIEVITTQGGLAVGWGFDTLSFTPVPLPGALLLFGSSMFLGFFTLRRRA